ncbi:hypothetical protein JW960_05935 [candidate division KSB1 bacterium]|nr:hypothetical protein [candidate division KSB1 bacterium]
MSVKKTSIKANLLIAIVALLCLFLFIAQHVSFPAIVWYVGLAILGIVSIALGIDHIRKKSASEVSGEDSQTYRTYTGTAAVLSGVASILIGIVLILISCALIFNAGNSMWLAITQRPGVALLLIGLLMIAWGGQAMIGAHEESPRRSVWLFLASLPGRMFGIILVVVGFAIGVFGVIDIFVPDELQCLYQTLKIFITNIFSI